MLTISVSWQILFSIADISLLFLRVTTATLRILLPFASLSNSLCILHIISPTPLPLPLKNNQVANHHVAHLVYCTPFLIVLLFLDCKVFSAGSFPHFGLFTTLFVFHLSWGVTVIDVINRNYPPTSKTNFAWLLSSLACSVHPYSLGCALYQQWCRCVRLVEGRESPWRAKPRLT